MKKLILALFLMGTFYVQAQSITAWTEENGTLGLGYPVPIPVDTTEAFDGFRTYAGLFAKHQSLVMNNPYITGQIMGQTRDQRDFWTYVLSDADNTTKYGVIEGAMLINGTVHAREWQSPELLTGIMELLDANSQDQSLHQFLLENTTIIVSPVNNIDGFLQTQRYPTENWYSSQVGPRDGRMRRKNMLDVDEDLQTQPDFLFGVDLNRNNSPYWATSSRSSFDVNSIVYHGAASQSEPETLAKVNAATLVDAEQIRIFTDVHSFTQVHFSVRTNIQNRNILQANLLQDFTNHHRAFPAGKNYVDSPSGPNNGIGATDEYFAETYEVPSWTLEIEPTGNGGLDYGGFGRNGHDGFILPESEIRRVREQLSQTFMTVWYKQAGPPSVTQIRIIDKLTGIVVYDASWDIQADGSRDLYTHVFENLQPDKDYSLIIAFDKPMRHRNNNDEIVHLQGQSGYSLNPNINATINGQAIDINPSASSWLNQKSQNVTSYKYYKDDTFKLDFSIPSDVVLDENSQIQWSIDVDDMMGQKLDGNPQTVITWNNGQWQNYEDSSGEMSIFGGTDNSYFVPIRINSLNSFEPMIQPSGLYYDPARSGEGFSYELLSNGNSVWIQWFTYDAQGEQRWFSGVGEYSANTIIVNSLTHAHGGMFGDEFNSANIVFEDFGSLEIIFNGGEALNPPVGSHTVARTAQVLFTDTNGNKLRTNLSQLSFVKGAVNQPADPLATIQEPVGLITGSWYDQTRSGEGYIIEILEDNRAILVWYTYDLAGNLMWLIDSNGMVTAQGNDITLDFNEVQVTDGGVFGSNFDASAVNLTPWGEVHFQLGCQGAGTINYTSVLDGFGNGQYNITKLTNPMLLSFVCDD